MKGDVSPVVYIVLAIIIAIAILAILFMLGLGPFTREGSTSFCKSLLLKACGKYETSGDLRAFDNVPSTCYSEVPECRNMPQTDAACVSRLCEWIKSGG
jgi:hypothetical protein